jgi:hypothetical protein
MNSGEFNIDTPKTSALTDNRGPRRLSIALVPLGYLVVDLAFLPMVRIIGRPRPFTDLFILFLLATVGIILSQFVCGAIWLVFGPYGIVKRSIILVAYTAAALLAFTISLLSFRDWSPLIWQDVVRPLFTCIPIILISLAVPLWLARGWLRWRVEPEQPRSNSRSMSILDMMLSTAFLGFALALPKFAGGTDANFIILSSLANGLLTGTLVTMPIIAFALRSRTFLAGIAFTTLLVFLETVLLCCVAFSFDLGQSGLTIAMPASLFCGFTLGVALPLLLAKQWGYRLRWGKQSALDDDQETAGPLSSD